MKQVFQKLFKHPLIKGSAVVFAGSMAANVSAWLYHVLVGRILGVERYGELAALFSLLFILNIPANVLQTVLVKFFSVYKAKNNLGQAKSLFLRVTRIILIGSLVGLTVLLPFLPFLGSFLHIPALSNFIWLYLVFASYIISVVNNSTLQGFQYFTEVSIYTNISMVLRLIFGTLLAFFGVGWTLIGNIVSNILGYGASFIPMRTLLATTEVPFEISTKKLVSYIIPTFLTLYGITALYTQDVLLVKHFFTSSQAGLYASLSILGKVIYFASSAVSFVLFPVIAERKELNRAHRGVVFGGVGIIAAVCIGISLLYAIYPSIVTVLFGPTFSPAIPYLGMFSVFITFFSLSSILINTLLALDAKLVWVVSLGAALLQLGLIVAYHGTLGQVIAANTAVSALLFVSLMLYYLLQV